MLLGGSYESRSVIAAAQNCMNLIPEPASSIQTMTAMRASTIGEPSPIAHYPTPGLRLFETMPDFPIRGIRQASSGGIYVAAGQSVYRLQPGGAPPTFLGSITAGLTTPVSMADNGLDLVIVDGSANGWTVRLTDDTFGMIPSNSNQPALTAASTAAITPSVARYTPFEASITGSITSATVTLATGFTGNLTASIFADAGGVPQAVLGEAVIVNDPVAGANVLAFGTPVPVDAGTQYWIGFDCDAGGGTWSVAAGTSGATSNTIYFYFPLDNPATTPAAAVICAVTMANDPGHLFVGADKVDVIDGFFLFNKRGTPGFYWSQFNATTFDPNALDFANKQGYPDNLVTLAVAKKEIFLLGERTSEIWFDAAITDPNTGFITSQFASIPGTFIDYGCAAKYSAAVNDNSVFWLSRDRSGRGLVMIGSGSEAKRISTYAIENAISEYAIIEDAIGWCYQLGGHVCYVLTFPNADHTWVYDASTGLWHEWLWTNADGIEHRHRAMCCYPCDGTVLVGDWEWSYVYVLDRDSYTDAGWAIKRVRSFPHLVNDGKRIFARAFIADLETGTGPAVDDTNLVSLEISTDRGHSYGSPVTQTLGGLGEYTTSVQWRRLGMARDFVFRISWQAAAQVVLQGAWVMLEAADADEPAPQQADG